MDIGAGYIPRPSPLYIPLIHTPTMSAPESQVTIARKDSDNPTLQGWIVTSGSGHKAVLYTKRHPASDMPLISIGYGIPAISVTRDCMAAYIRACRKMTNLPTHTPTPMPPHTTHKGRFHLLP